MPNTATKASSLSFAKGLEHIVRESKILSASADALAADVRVTLAISTLCGDPIQEQLGTLTAENFKNYCPKPEAQDRAIKRATELGLKVIKSGRFGITVGGPAELIREVCRTDLVVHAQSKLSGAGATADSGADFAPTEATDLFLTPPDSLVIPAEIGDAVDHFVFTPPPIYFQPSPIAPTVNFHNVDEADICRILNVPEGFQGNGVKVGVIDTGFYDHPYYQSNGLNYRAISTVSAPDAHEDNYGHGTAITYNVFAVAPGAEVLGFKQSSPPQDAIEDAADEDVQIITCSWGYPHEQVFPILQATILSIVADGVIVMFAAGNGHYAWPGSDPGVLSIGGVYSNERSKLEASNYASGYMSNLFPGRRIPDVCGLCGQRPKAIYIMMPTQPDNTMDRDISGMSFPDFDETAPDDGWVGASGTSSATPQIAGVVALMVEKAMADGRSLDTADVKAFLEQSSTAITIGRNAMGFPATGQPNAAVGWGLVNAAAALALV